MSFVVSSAKLNGEYDKQITAVFTQWESDLQKTKEAEEKLQVKLFSLTIVFAFPSI